MSARRDAALYDAISQADIATSDGVPLVWLLRLTSRPGQTRVYGPDLMKLALQSGVERGWRHYLYGTTPPTLDRLRSAIARFAPGAVVVGQMAPPFRDLTPAETDDVVAELAASNADIIWVGLGMPRQEKWMHQIAPRLPGKTLVGVGAAFDLLSGTVPQAPPLLQRAGLEWAFRLWQEPRRLWRRYVLNNPMYLVLAAHSGDPLPPREPRRRGVIWRGLCGHGVWPWPPPSACMTGEHAIPTRHPSQCWFLRMPKLSQGAAHRMR